MSILKRQKWLERKNYHWKNPQSKNDKDKYLDKKGNPTGKNCKESHLTLGKYNNKRVKDDHQSKIKQLFCS